MHLVYGLTTCNLKSINEILPSTKVKTETNKCCDFPEKRYQKTEFFFPGKKKSGQSAWMPWCQYWFLLSCYNHLQILFTRENYTMSRHTTGNNTSAIPPWTLFLNIIRLNPTVRHQVFAYQYIRFITIWWNRHCYLVHPILQVLDEKLKVKNALLRNALHI